MSTVTNEWTNSTAPRRDIRVCTSGSGVSMEADVDGGDGHGETPTVGISDTITTSTDGDRPAIDGLDRRHRSIGALDPDRLVDRFALRIRNRHSPATLTVRLRPRPESATDAVPFGPAEDVPDESYLPDPAAESDPTDPSLSYLSDSTDEIERNVPSAASRRPGESRTIPRTTDLAGPDAGTRVRSGSKDDRRWSDGDRFETAAESGSLATGGPATPDDGVQSAVSIATDAVGRHDGLPVRSHSTTALTDRVRRREGPTRPSPFETTAGTDTSPDRTVVGEPADPAVAGTSRSPGSGADRYSSPRRSNSTAYTVLVDEPGTARPIERRTDRVDAESNDETGGESRGRSRSVAGVVLDRWSFRQRSSSSETSVDSARGEAERPTVVTATDGVRDSPGGSGPNRSAVTSATTATQLESTAVPHGNDHERGDRTRTTSGTDGPALVTAAVRPAGSSATANGRRSGPSETDGTPVSSASMVQLSTAGRTASDPQGRSAILPEGNRRSADGSSRQEPRSAIGTGTAGRRSVDGERSLDRSSSPELGLSNAFARRVRAAHAVDPETAPPDGRRERPYPQFEQVGGDGGLGTALTTAEAITQLRSVQPSSTAGPAIGTDTDTVHTGARRSTVASRPSIRPVRDEADVATETRTETVASTRGATVDRTLEPSNGGGPVDRTERGTGATGGATTDSNPRVSGPFSDARAEWGGRHDPGARPRVTTETTAATVSDDAAGDRDRTEPAGVGTAALDSHSRGSVSFVPESIRRRRRLAVNRMSKAIGDTGGPTSPLTPRVVDPDADSTSAPREPTDHSLHRSTDPADRRDVRADSFGPVSPEHPSSANGTDSVLGSSTVSPSLAAPPAADRPTSRTRGESTHRSESTRDRSPTDGVTSPLPIEGGSAETQSRSAVDRTSSDAGGRRSGSDVDTVDDHTRFGPKRFAHDRSAPAIQGATVLDPNWSPSKRSTRFDTDAAPESTGAAAETRSGRPQATGQRRHGIAPAGAHRSSSGDTADVGSPVSTTDPLTVRTPPQASDTRNGSETIPSSGSGADRTGDGRGTDVGTRATVASNTVARDPTTDRLSRGRTPTIFRDPRLSRTATEPRVTARSANGVDESKSSTSDTDSEISKYKIDNTKAKESQSETRRMNSSTNRPSLVYRDPTPSASAGADATRPGDGGQESAETAIGGGSVTGQFTDEDPERSLDSGPATTGLGPRGRGAGSARPRSDGTVSPADRHRGNVGDGRKGTNREMRTSRGRRGEFADRSPVASPQRADRIDGPASGREPAGEQPTDPVDHERGRRRPRDRSESPDLPWDGESPQFGADVDRIVERLYRKLERKQRIERERRGL